MLEPILAVLLGLAGGIARAFQSGRLVAPSRETDEDGREFIDPGIWGPIVVGMVAGLLAWLFNASAENPGVDLRPLAWALVAGIGGDIALDYYLTQKYSASDRENAGGVVEQMSEGVNTISREVEQAHEERRKAQEERDHWKNKCAYLQGKLDELENNSGDP